MRPSELIQALSLQPHPEGGWYAETWRSPATVQHPDGRRRPASTCIHFLLDAGDFSAWHTVRSEEIWFFHAGQPLELHLLGPSGHTRTLLSDQVLAGHAPHAVVPAGQLQAARSTGWTLVSCVVAPGFDFADFAMPGREQLLRDHPDQRAVIEAFTRA
jgi:predicted cupin superfamily sugar epimerase